MQIFPDFKELVWLNVSLSLHSDRTFHLRLSLSLLLSQNFEVLAQQKSQWKWNYFTFGLCQDLDRTLPQQKAKSKSEVSHCCCCCTRSSAIAAWCKSPAVSLCV